MHRRQPLPPRHGRLPRVQLPDPDPGHPRARAEVEGSLREGHRALHRRRVRLRVPQRDVQEVRAHRRGALWRAALRALLHDGPHQGGLHADEQRHGQHQPHVRDQGVRAGLPPHQARHDGRVRDAEHRHRRGVPHRGAQRSDGHTAVPEAGQLVLPPLEVPRQHEHDLLHEGVADAHDGPEPGRRVRRRDGGDDDGPGAHQPPRLRRRLRHGAEPILHPGRGRAPDDGVRQGRPDARVPRHPRHRAVHPDRVR
mmetsp:Transcript_6055/g.22149  ORF Transcript_6055/g.22149 Transcript_6055/m.22149 type:complete len:253 (-) Transcript_6055:658-1416(-)